MAAGPGASGGGSEKWQLPGVSPGTTGPAKGLDMGGGRRGSVPGLPGLSNPANVVSVTEMRKREKNRFGLARRDGIEGLFQTQVRDFW